MNRPWFRFANGHWSRALSRVWLLTPLGWNSIYTLEAENVPVLAGMNLLENHDISFRRNEFLVHDAERTCTQCPIETLSVRSSNSESAVIGTGRIASCFSHATAGDFFEDPREQDLNVSSACMFGLSRHPLSRVCHHSNPASDTSHRSWSIPVSTHSGFAVFPHENVCQPSSLHFKLRSIKTRLNWLQTVIDGQKSRRTLDEMSKLHRSRLDTSFCTRRSGSSQLASDETLSRRVCTEQSYTANQHGAWISCARCALRLHYIPRHTARMTSVSTPSSASVQEALKRMSLLERQRLHGEGGGEHDCRSRGTEASKEEVDTTNDDRVQHRVQFWSGIQCDDQLGNSSAQRSFDTTITSVLSDNSSLAPLCCEHPPEGKDESQTGKCTDDGRGFVKTLSGRLARKLQRSASLVSAGLSKQIQTMLDAATVDRCDFVEICCSDVPCLTEAMQRSGLSSSSLLRSDGVGNHGAKTREKILSLAFRETTLEGLVLTSGHYLSEQFEHAAVSDRDRFSDSFSGMLQQF